MPFRPSSTHSASNLPGTLWRSRHPHDAPRRGLSRRARALAAVAGTTVLAATGVLTAPTASAQVDHHPADRAVRTRVVEQTPAPVLDWQACGPTAPDFQCATMKAPLDYDVPAGARIDVAVIRHLATDPAHRVGSVVWNAGGPGGAPTAVLPAAYPLFPAGLRTRFDIVGFDPRGIGGSDQLRCFATPEQEDVLLGQLPVGFPVGAAETAKAVEVNAELDRNCALNGGPIQYHMGTADVARDMDRLRAALGERLLDYYGPSYGTYLGVTYANLFPSRVGHVVLDGNVPPLEWNDANAGTSQNTFQRLGAPEGSEVALETMLGECGRVTTDRCAFSAGSPDTTIAKYRSLLARVKARPVTVDGTRYTYALTVATTNSLLGAQNANGLEAGWKALAALLQTVWAQSQAPAGTHVAVPAGVRSTMGSGSAVGGLTTPFPAQLPEGLDGVLCSDSPNPRNPFAYPGGNAGAPDGSTAVWSWLAQPCAQWQARAQDRYTGPWDRSTKPYLLIGTLADPNTPYSSTLRMAAQLPNARVLTEAGGGHTALFNKSACVDRSISAYFVDGSLPAVGTVCQQDQEPF